MYNIKLSKLRKRNERDSLMNFILFLKQFFKIWYPDTKNTEVSSVKHKDNIT